ncbi:MAG TPA: hypothetical protein VMR98_00590 [Candidatus Polarisedimenticolaceae bacterium]|nr:hypothetical protein [Candidatus Polarisedimenticolaceae bacterium]
MTPAFERQTDSPLFPDILWNRPAMKSRGGRLLVLGGQTHQFNNLQATYEVAEAAGIGEVDIVMPDSLRATAGRSGLGRFVPSSPSGSLGKAALGEILHLAGETDAVVIGANLTNNAETGMMIESLIRELDTRVIITEEAFEILQFHPELITGNPKALVVTTMRGLFDLANHHRMPIAIKPNAGVIGKLEILQQLASISKSQYLVFDREVMVAAEDKLSLTPLQTSLASLPAAAIGVAATFWVQQPGKLFQTLTTAAYVLSAAASAADKDETAPTYASLSRQIEAALRQHEH